MILNEVQKKHPDEWILVEVLDEDDNNNPIEVRLLSHSKNRDDTYRAMKEYSDKYTYHFYNGEILEKGYAVVF